MPYKNIEEQKKFQKQWYLENKDRIKKKSKISKQKGRAAKYKFVNELKDNPCEDCGVVYPPCVMDFHHIEGEKEKNIAWMVYHNFGWKRLLAEIQKCILLCANCHRMRTHNCSPYV